MNKHNAEFDRLASNAAAMNAEDAFDRCLAELQEHGYDRRAARLSFVKRIVAMNPHDSGLENKALAQVYTYLSHSRTEDEVLARRSIANGRWAVRRQLEALRNYPEHNNDPTACKRALGEYGVPVV